MMEDTFLVNIVKERMCYVSLDFIADMHKTKYPAAPARSFVCFETGPADHVLYVFLCAGKQTIGLPVSIYCLTTRPPIADMS